MRSPRRFLLTRPSRDVTSRQRSQYCSSRFLLTRPSRDVTGSPFSPSCTGMISTHTSLTGRDDTPPHCRPRTGIISTHTSLTGRDYLNSVQFESRDEFLLTRPSRDVTPEEPIRAEYPEISTHTSLTGRDLREYGCFIW